MKYILFSTHGDVEAALDATQVTILIHIFHMFACLSVSLVIDNRRG